MGEQFPHALNLLRAGYPAADIINEIYARVGSDRGYVELRQPVQQMTCLAAHYGNRELMLTLLHPGVSPEPSPLLTAAHDGNPDLVKCLVKLETFRSDERVLGIVREDKVSSERRSPMEIAMEKDDPKLMGALEAVYASPCIPLAHLAVQYDAQACLEALVQASHDSLYALACTGRDLLLTAASASITMLNRVVQLGIGDVERRTGSERTAMHLAIEPPHKGWCPDSPYPPSVQAAWPMQADMAGKLRILLELGVGAMHADHHGMLPLDTLVFHAIFKDNICILEQLSEPQSEQMSEQLSEHSERVLAACEQLLSIMAPAPSTDAAVPRDTVDMLLLYQTTLFAQLGDTWPSAVGWRAYGERILPLIQRLLEMVLHKGVVTSQPGLRYSDTILDSYLGRFRNSMPAANAVAFLYLTVRALLVYGIQVSAASFPVLARLHRAQWWDTHVMDMCRGVTYMCASLMPHALFQEYRAWVQRQRNEGQQLPRLPAHHSLLEVARLALYSAVPGRRMEAYMHRIHMPHLMRKYLTLAP